MKSIVKIALGIFFGFVLIITALVFLVGSALDSDDDSDYADADTEYYDSEYGDQSCPTETSCSTGGGSRGGSCTGGGSRGGSCSSDDNSSDNSADEYYNGTDDSGNTEPGE